MSHQINTLIISILLSLVPSSASGKWPPLVTPLVNSSRQAHSAKVIPFTFPGMPVRIDSVTAESPNVGWWLNCSVTNLANDNINTVNFSILIVNSDNKVSRPIEAFSVSPISSGGRRMDRIMVDRELEPDEFALIAVTKAVGRSGIWTIDARALTKAVKAKLNKQPDADPTVKYETHTVLTREDSNEILRLGLEDILRDERKAAHLKYHSTVTLLSDGDKFDLPSIQDVPIISLSLDEIQKVANAIGRVVYLVYQPLVIEGSRVFARIALRDTVSQKDNRLRVAYKYTFLLICVKKNGRWVIQESTGYSQS